MNDANVTIKRPQLTEEERAERMKQVESRIIDFWLAVKRKEQEKWKAET